MIDGRVDSNEVSTGFSKQQEPFESISLEDATRVVDTGGHPEVSISDF